MWDVMAHHQMVVDEQGNLVAVGQLQIKRRQLSVDSLGWPFTGRAGARC
ncbi:hypothetical protein ACLK1T_11190 [Escherichia coli]